METPGNEKGTPLQFGDRTTSDVVVRLRTPEGRDEWLYSHTSILTKKSKYFADRLSDTWPTCQILDARSCVEVHSQDSDFDYHITLLRLFYVVSDSLISESEHGVRNALGILRVAIELDCPIIVSACVEFLESVPWEESEEEEILRTIPNMGPSVNPILSRLQPVDPATIFRIFLSALRLAMSSPPPSLRDLKTSAQEQLEYMLTDDDDAPLLAACDKVKLEVRECTKTLFSNFCSLLESLSKEDKTTISKKVKLELLESNLSDLSWVCQISSKLEIMRDVVTFWSEVSNTLIRTLEDETSISETLEIKFKTIEVATKIIEAIGYGTVILPTAKRLHMVNLWLPFARSAKPIIDASSNDIDEQRTKSDIWKTLESALISIILALPSEYQADILSEWLGNKHIQYPDLTEAFEVWCYRSKVAKKRLASCVSPFESS
ncbi:hypothetical protein RND81_08G161100 [Saponaria officinalis]|uniref:BTB domain-containing protein n=1 Tax=Saponaria officinalis TaxID=3572 RepID=A0AAW1J7V3_SAPOF